MKFVNKKTLTRTFSNFSKGLNTLVNPTKIRDDQLSVATNTILIDEGSPSKRYGSGYYDLASSGSDTTGLFGYYSNQTGIRQVCKIEDGIFKKLETTGLWSVIPGASFSSGIRTRGVLAYDTLYLSNGVDALTKYDGTTLTRFTDITAPTSNWVTRGASLASGQYLYSYRVTALNAVGETLACAAATVAVNKNRNDWRSLSTLPDINYGVTVNWSAVTEAVGGYNIYGVTGGFESYIGTTPAGVTNYLDYGDNLPSDFFTIPLASSTTGAKGKYIMEYKSSLIISGDSEAPSRVYYSAGLDKIDSFLIGDGGGFVDISKNAIDGIITGMGKYQNKIVIFKERSSWEFDFSTSDIPSVSTISGSLGAVSNDSIITVENDLYFLGRKAGGGAAIYSLGNEPNFVTILRTNELSARVRPELRGLSPSNFEKAVAVYFDSKYMLFFADGGSASNDSAIVYDRERQGFTRWEGLNVKIPTIFYNDTNDEEFLFIDGSDNRTSYIDSSLETDKGTPISWRYRTKEDDLGEPFLFKRYKFIKVRLKDVAGRVYLRVWTDGTITLYSTVLVGTLVSTAFGVNKFGSGRFGRTNNTDSQVADNVVIKRIPIYREGLTANATSISLELYGDSATSKATLLDAEFDAKPKSIYSYPQTQQIN